MPTTPDESEVPPQQSGAAESSEAAVDWHVQVFPVRKTVTKLFRGRQRVSVGFGWSASGEPEGYEYRPGPFKTYDEAVADAKTALTGQGGSVTRISGSGSGVEIDVD